MKALFLIWACLLLTIPCSADVIYVKQGGTGSGTSWADPNGVLQIGIGYFCVSKRNLSDLFLYPKEGVSDDI